MAVFTKTVRKHVFVHPSDEHKFHSSIKNALLKDKKKYSDSLEGALLDVCKIRVIGDRYLVVHGYLSMEVVADFEVFSPTVGMTLEGMINKVQRNHFGCLVMNLFNASLTRLDNFEIIPKEGDACSFVVTKLVVDGDILFMRGKLTSVTPREPLPVSAEHINTTNQDISITATDAFVFDPNTVVKPEEITPKKKSKKSAHKSVKNEDKLKEADMNSCDIVVKQEKFSSSKKKSKKSAHDTADLEVCFSSPTKKSKTSDLNTDTAINVKQEPTSSPSKKSKKSDKNTDDAAINVKHEPFSSPKKKSKKSASNAEDDINTYADDSVISVKQETLNNSSKKSKKSVIDTDDTVISVKQESLSSSKRKSKKCVSHDDTALVEEEQEVFSSPKDKSKKKRKLQL